MEREIDKLQEAKAYAKKYGDDIAAYRRIGRKGEKRPTIIEDIIKPDGRSKSIAMNNTTSLIFRQSPSDGSYSRRVESFVASSGGQMDSASK